MKAQVEKVMSHAEVQKLAAPEGAGADQLAEAELISKGLVNHKEKIQEKLDKKARAKLEQGEKVGKEDQMKRG